MNVRTLACRIAFGHLIERPDYGTQSHTAILQRRLNPETDTVQYALVSKSLKDSKGRHKVLRYFGPEEPSGAEIAKAEAIIKGHSK